MSKSKRVTIDISSDDDDDVDELVSGTSKSTRAMGGSTRSKPSSSSGRGKRPTGFGGFVSAFGTHPLSSSSSTTSSMSTGRPTMTTTLSSNAHNMHLSPALPTPSLPHPSSNPAPRRVTGTNLYPAEPIILDSSSGEEDSRLKGLKRKRSGPSRSNRTVRMPTSQVEEKQREMWTDLYRPLTIPDLAPSKTRLTQLKTWLEESITGVPAALDPGESFSTEARLRVRKYRRILILSGPAGVGKTTSLKVIAEELGMDVIEWNEGFEEWGLSGDFEKEGLGSKMITFLSRNTYAALPLSASTSSTGTSSNSTPSQPNSKPRLLLLTSLPNLSHYPTRETFHQSLLTYAREFRSTSCPLVIIVPDVGQMGAAEESWSMRKAGGEGVWDVRNVVGEECLACPSVMTIEFLPMAPTFTSKALHRIVERAIPDPTHRPSRETINLISQSCNGDLRSAINSLEMMCKTKGAGVLTRSGPGGVKRGKGSKGGKGGQGTGRLGSKEVRELLNQIARREQSLNLFHALGKLLYNKRLGDSDPDGSYDPTVRAIEERFIIDNPLPAHLAHRTRARFENSYEDLYGSIPVDSSTLSLWVHQNYPGFVGDVDEMAEVGESICEADLVGNVLGGVGDSASALPYTFHLLALGVTCFLPSPVPRAGLDPSTGSSTSSGNANTHSAGRQMTKPDFFQHLKQTTARARTIERVTKDLNKLGVRARGGEVGLDYMPFLRMGMRRGFNLGVGLELGEETFGSMGAGEVERYRTVEGEGEVEVEVEEEEEDECTFLSDDDIED